jgi:hypothetical protein
LLTLFHPSDLSKPFQRQRDKRHRRPRSHNHHRNLLAPPSGDEDLNRQPAYRRTGRRSLHGNALAAPRLERAHIPRGVATAHPRYIETDTDSQASALFAELAEVGERT